ncbi:hypothetical protein OAH34_03495 [bacterium]|jgi:hypothetical protein|nr:hypothetical protein [bacterium]
MIDQRVSAVDLRSQWLSLSNNVDQPIVFQRIFEIWITRFLSGGDTTYQRDNAFRLHSLTRVVWSQLALIDATVCL